MVAILRHPRETLPDRVMLSSPPLPSTPCWLPWTCSRLDSRSQARPRVL